MAPLVYSQRARVDWKTQASEFFRIASDRFRGCGKIALLNNIEQTLSNTDEIHKKHFYFVQNIEKLKVIQLNIIKIKILF